MLALPVYKPFFPGLGVLLSLFCCFLPVPVNPCSLESKIIFHYPDAVAVYTISNPSFIIESEHLL